MAKDYLYNKVKDYLSDIISNMEPYSKIPPRSTICSQLGVGKITVDRAISEFIGNGSLYSINGSGTYVAEKSDSATASWGVIVPHIDEFSFPSFIKGIDGVARKNGINIIICGTENNLDKTKYYISNLIESKVQGVIIVPSSYEPDPDPEIYKAFQQCSIPIVFAIRRLPGYNVPLVESNEFLGFYLITKHLIEHRYSPIAFIGQRYYSIFDFRLTGYATALTECGIDYNEDYVYIHSNFDERDAAVKGIDYLLSLPKIPRACVCFNDLIATIVSDECIKRGLKIPNDLAITGADNTHICDLMQVKLTSVDCSRYQIGISAAEKLLSMTKKSFDDFNDPSKLSVNILPQSIVIRESCGCERR
jgi:GntR family transcriptional regulator of arabinose operon